MENHFITLKPIKTIWFYLLLIIAIIISLLDIFEIIHCPRLQLMSLFSLFVYVMILKKQSRQQLKTLIYTCDNIIEEKPLTLFEGEGELAILSSKLEILNERYTASINQLNQDKIILKEQIDNISHQLKTPLTTMQITEDLLLEMSLDKSVETMILSLQNRTIHISHLIDLMLKLSRVEAEAVHFDFQNHSFLDMMSEIENSLAMLLREADVKLRYDNKDFEIFCDRLWLLEAFENIIKNCIEKTRQSPIDITISKHEYNYSIVIQDHGPGIQEDPPERIFERFYHDKFSSGAGIGLCLTKEIIRAHHGSIHVKNNGGACFEIELPIFYLKEHL